MRCEYLDNPLGIDTPSPRFTWTVESDKPFMQAGYTLRVATSPEALAKGRGEVWTHESVSPAPRAVYGGPAPESHKRYYWDVTVRGTRSERFTSAPAWFETAKMSAGDWQADWISDGFNKEFRKSPLLRKNFALETGKTVKRARAYVCGIGYYELFLNGERVGDRMLDPAYTAFDKRVIYSTYDVTDMLRAGDNAVAAALGNGWLNIQSMSVWRFELAEWRRRPQLLCELRVEYTDGTVQTIASDTSWRTASGAYVFNNLYSGDVYDARLEAAGWKEPGFDDRKTWKDAVEVDAPAPVLVAQSMPPIRVRREITPVSHKDFPGNIRVYDMGENFAGVCRLKVKGEAGTRITLKHAELVHADGRLNQGNIDIYFQREKNGMPLHRDPQEVFQTDTYYLRGGDPEQFTPSFTYHGFQYVEVESDRPVQIESLTGLFLCSDVEDAGGFSCSNDVLNRIVKATRQSYLSNLHSIPTDCPQREKNGWLADAYIAIDLALLNFDGVGIYEKWLRDFADNQRPRGDISGIIPSYGWGFADWIGPVWDAAMFIIPSTLYRYYGDLRSIEQIWPSCVRYLEYLKTRESEEGTLTYGIGDWVFYKAKTNTEYTSTAFYYLDNVLMAQFAALLGHDPAPYNAKAAELKKLINAKFFDPSTLLYAGGTQAGQSVALALGLVPDGMEQGVADRMAEMIRGNNHSLDFGMLGSKFVTRMLSKYGYAEDAYKMVVNPDAPSWSQWMSLGLTALPETWVLDKDYKDASLNHVFLGDVSAWMVNDIAGINPGEDSPGFGHIVIRPHFIKDLSWAQAHYDSVRGVIRSSWSRQNGKVTLQVTIPAGSTATVWADKRYEVKSGNHKFTITE